MSLHAEVVSRLEDVDAAAWDAGFRGSPGLNHAFLRLVEESEINDLKHYYVLTRDSAGQVVGRSNLYKVPMDFASMDRLLPAPARATVKRWFPDLMLFNLLEAGQFTSIGDSIQSTTDERLEDVLRAVIQEMEDIAQHGGVDFFLIRDVPLSRYERYRDVLRPLGYLPTCGFANAWLELPSSFEQFLETHSSKTRYKLRKSLEIQAKLGIDVEVTRDYAALSLEMERLWRNVNSSALEYSREQLNARFFELGAKLLADNSEAIVFRHRGKPIAFMLNLFAEDQYVMLDWGVDYDLEFYREANLYRAASVLSVKRAIELGKKRMELGITNYVPKALLGASIEPLAYFVKHVSAPRKTRTLVKIMTDSVRPPDELRWPRVEEQLDVPPGIHWKNVVTSDQTWRKPTDVFIRVESSFKFDAMRLAGIYGLYPEFQTAQTPRIRSSSSEMILLGTNSYLGLATDPRVVEAAVAALRRYGSGCSGSPLLNGTLDIHVKLERELAAFMQKPAAAVCSTGYQTNLAALSAVCGPGDLVVMDARNHRSLFDGVKLSGAEYVVYGHRDVAQLRRVLQRRTGRRTIIVTDSVFSMEGTLVPLAEICAVAEEVGARLYVDESHALGVLGPSGRGLAEQLGLLDRVDLVMGTFSKSLAAVGGFVAGDTEVIDHIKHNGGGHVFSASLPPAVVAAARAALGIIQSEPELRARVLEKAAYAAARLRELGYAAEFHGVPIVPVVMGNTTLALAAYKRFMGEGLYVNPVGPPAVPEECAGFRTSYMASHTWADIDNALAIFARHRADFAGTVPARPTAEQALVGAATETLNA
jgi:8-amino-7-oxononanoate synthase